MQNAVIGSEPAGPTAVAGERILGGPVAIEVRDVHKSFRIPEQRRGGSGAAHGNPMARIEHHELHALGGVSFEVHRGEFFGIVGRNGSGKSSLLKILASIYRADAGRVRVAGRMAPFIELGVGFNPELTARENIVLNGVLMGLTRREAARRLGAVIDFSELAQFADLKLKNYSSGMMVRLAFSIMVQADADIMLVDEVLAVGDAAFAQKCMDFFADRRRAGKTIVLVTHDMATVQSLCHRAMLLDKGVLEYIGPPEETALRYFRKNFGAEVVPAGAAGPVASADTDTNIRVLGAKLRDRAGNAVENVEEGTPIAIEAVLEAIGDLSRPDLVLHLVNDDGTVIAAFNQPLDGPVAAGERIHLRGEVENRLVGGRYYLDCWVRSDRDDSTALIHSVRMLRFLVYGTAPRHGLVTLHSDVEPVLEPVEPR